jgi:hypothetical protein
MNQDHLFPAAHDFLHLSDTLAIKTSHDNESEGDGVTTNLHFIDSFTVKAAGVTISHRFNLPVLVKAETSYNGRKVEQTRYYRDGANAIVNALGNVNLERLGLDEWFADEDKVND